MKVLTAAEMREVDRRTEELGIPGVILMENAGCRVVDFLVERFGSMTDQKILILCGKGNNGGDGFVVARQLLTRFKPKSLHVVSSHPEEASAPRTMFEGAGGRVASEISHGMRSATIVVDALLGTGLSGSARGRSAELIQEINQLFHSAFVVAVDVPSGMSSDSGLSAGEFTRADATVTFTSLKPCHAFSPNCDHLGIVHVGQIGTPELLMEEIALHLSEPADFHELLAPRKRDSNKGTYGHVLVVGGAKGKGGAARMTAFAALRSGSGLVTVASCSDALPEPELMTARLPSTYTELSEMAARQNVIAIGPGLGLDSEHVQMVREAVSQAGQILVLDADALNAIAGETWRAADNHVRVLTPHPGEMARLTGKSTKQVQEDRLTCAREFAAAHNCLLVLKGYRTIIAFPDGRTWINPTGTPALSTGGTGDILTGILAGLLAQFPEDPEHAVIAGVYLHGLAAQKAELTWGEKSLVATDLLSYLPEAIRECSQLPN